MVPSIIASLFFRPVMDCSSTRWLRWALNCQLWKPVATQWNHANKCIQEEERQRIEQFVFQAPAISSLIGRLMLRKGIQEVIGSSNSNITFSRTAEGRPFLPGLDIIDINVSHHGDWVVLALESGARVGVDVMSMDRPINKDLREYFRLMRKQFTDNEWRQIDKSDNKLHAFYRFWCLKESYVKAIGVGLKYDLQTIDFNTSDELSRQRVIKSTKMKLKDQSSDELLFEETLLDMNHCVATCIAFSEQGLKEGVCDKPFTEVTIEHLLNLETITDEVDEGLWTRFNSKQYSAR